MELLWTNWLIGFVWASSWSMTLLGAFCGFFGGLMIPLLTLALIGSIQNLYVAHKNKQNPE